MSNYNGCNGSFDRPVTIIPAEAIMALARTHVAFQNDKTSLSYEAARLIGNAVEFRLKQIIQMAQRFMISSLRPHKVPTLLPIDVNNALITLKMPVIDGYSNYYDYRYIRATKLYKGNRVIKREYSVRKTTDEKFLGRFKLVNVIQQDMTSPVPASPGLGIVWFIVNNKVPPIASTFARSFTFEFIKRAQEQILLKHASKVDFLNVSDANARLDHMSRLAATFYQGSASTLTLQGLHENHLTSQAIVEAINRQMTSSDVCGHLHSKVLVLPRVEHLLTKEHVFFLKEIRNTIRRAATSLDPEAQVQLSKVFAILKNSPALGQLLPELAHFFACEMQNGHVQDVSVLIRFAEATSCNEKIQIHSHAHQFLTPLLNVMLGPDSEADLSSPSAIYTRIHHRKLAASAIGKISLNLKLHGNGLEAIDSVLIKIYKAALAQDKCTLPMLYGIIVGIEHLPLIAKRLILYPLVPLVMKLISRAHVHARMQMAITRGPCTRLNEFKMILTHEIQALVVGILYKSGLQLFKSLVAEASGVATCARGFLHVSPWHCCYEPPSGSFDTRWDDEDVEKCNLLSLHIATSLSCDNDMSCEALIPIFCAILSHGVHEDILSSLKSANLAADAAIVATDATQVQEIENARQYMLMHKAANFKSRFDSLDHNGSDLDAPATKRRLCTFIGSATLIQKSRYKFQDSFNHSQDSQDSYHTTRRSQDTFNHQNTFQDSSRRSQDSVPASGHRPRGTRKIENCNAGTMLGLFI